MEEKAPKLMKKVFGNVNKSYFKNEIIFPNETEV